MGGPVAESFPSEGGNALLTLRRLGEDEAGCSFHGEGNQTIAGKRRRFLGFLYALGPRVFTDLL